MRQRHARPAPAATGSRLAPFGLAVALACTVALAGCADRDTPPASSAAERTSAITTWPMTRGGPALSGNVAASAPVNPKVAWTFVATGPVTGEAALADGRVFIGTDKGTLHCLNAENGREQWRFETKGAITASPAIASGKVYVSSHDGNLYALTADTGKEVWRFTTQEKISSGATVIRNPENTGDWVLLNGYDGATRVLDASDGKLVWSYKTDDYVNGSPAIVDGRYVVFGGCDAQLHVVNLKDGSLVHKVPTSAYIPASIATHGALAYCGNHGNETVAFDVAAGKILWVYADRAMPFFSSPAVNESLVFIGSRDKHLHAIHRDTGAGAWRFRTGGRIEASPVVFEDAVVFASADGRLYAAEPQSGAERWQLDLGEPLVGSPAYGDRQLVIGGEKGTVFAIRDSGASAEKRGTRN